MRKINDAAAGKTKLDMLATVLIREAIDGDVPALKEIADRLDGKVPQALVGGDEDSRPIALQFIELRAVQPK